MLRITNMQAMWELAARAEALKSGVKQPWAIVLQGPPGCGKTLLTRMLFGDVPILPRRHSAFNPHWAMASAHPILAVEDPYPEDWEDLKDLISSAHVVIHRQAQWPTRVSAKANFIICTGSPLPLAVAEGDRRFIVFNVGEV